MNSNLNEAKPSDTNIQDGQSDNLNSNDASLNQEQADLDEQPQVQRLNDSDFGSSASPQKLEGSVFMGEVDFPDKNFESKFSMQCVPVELEPSI